MKISKTAILTLWSLFLVGSMWLILVNAQEPDPEPEEEVEVNVYVDPSNAVQHIQEVQFVSTGGNTKKAKMKRKDNRLVWIETNIDFILSKTWDDTNIILTQDDYNSILWWIKNKILDQTNVKSKYSVILAWLENIIAGKLNTIVWWKNNSILWENSTILGWSKNYINGNYSVVVWSGNHVTGNYSVVVWSDSTVEWSGSVSLWSASHIKSNNSFLSNNSELTSEGRNKILNVDNAFSINSDSGVVINSDEAHSFSKLTIWWPLSIFSNSDDENIQCGSWNGWWILKVVNTNVGQMCLCSCDGSGWNSVFARGTCVGACTQPQKPECGDTVERVCSDEGGFTYLWSCNTWSFPIEGEGSYLVDKYDKVHWSCQTEDGSIVFCSGGISNVVNECAHRCEWNLPNNAIANGRQITDRAGVEYFYDPTWTGDCSYSCMSGFNYVIEDGRKLCVKCKDGTYNTGSRTCEQEAVCTGDTVPYNGSCIHLGNCTERAATLSTSKTEQFSFTNPEWYNNMENIFKPYGAQEEIPWRCKPNSGDVNLHSCEFSCKPGYHCSYWTGANNRNGYYCASDDAGCYWLSAKYSPSSGSFMYYPEIWWIRWHHPIDYSWAAHYGWDNYLKTEYVDTMEEIETLRDTFTTWCYSFCDLGFYKTPGGAGWFCNSNCIEMFLGWKDKNGNPIDVHGWDGKDTTWWFHNWRFPKPGNLVHWEYVTTWVLDDYITNDTWRCVWTCRSWIPITGLKYKTEFKSKFTYKNGTNEYNTCWEECPANYYFSWFLCVKVSSSEYIPDRDKIITYWGITNSYAQKKACDTGNTYKSGHCIADVTNPNCTSEWYEYVDGVCITCPDGWWFTGYNHECAEYDRCDVNHNRRINLNDKDSIYNCTMSWALCNWRENLDGTWGVNSGDLEYFDEICTRKLDYNMCDINDDWLFDTNDHTHVAQHLNVCSPMNNCSLIYDFDKNWQVNIADVVKFWDICVIWWGW